MFNLIVSTALFAAFDIAAIVVGALNKDADTSCVTPLVAFNAAVWLLAGGSVVLIVKFIFTYFVFRGDSTQEISFEIVNLIRACMVFMFAWAVVGIVILASTGEACATFSKSVYIMSIIYIITLILGFSVKSILHLKKGKNSSNLSA